jgi:hypothetical protein
MNFEQANELKQNFAQIRSTLNGSRYGEDVSKMIQEILSGLEMDLENPCPIDINIDERNENIDFDASEVIGFTEDLKSFVTSDSSSSEMTSKDVSSMFFRRSCRCSTKPKCPPAQRIDSFIGSFPDLFPTKS